MSFEKSFEKHSQKLDFNKFLFFDQQGPLDGFSAMHASTLQVEQISSLFDNIPKLEQPSFSPLSFGVETLTQELAKNSLTFQLPPEKKEKSPSERDYRKGAMLANMITDPYASLVFEFSVPTEKVRKNLPRDVVKEVDREIAIRQAIAPPVKIGEISRETFGYIREKIDLLCSSSPESQQFCDTVIEETKEVIEMISIAIPDTVKDFAHEVQTVYNAQIELTISDYEKYGIEEQEVRDLYSGVTELVTSSTLKGAFSLNKPHTAHSTSRRVSYAEGYEQSARDCFSKVNEFRGELKRDLFVVRYHSGLENSPGMWFTPIAQGNKLATINAVMDELALLSSWGERAFVSLAKIPAGETVRFFHGRALKQFDLKNQEFRPGGGIQYRFYDFDPSWVVETRKIPVQ